MKKSLFSKIVDGVIVPIVVILTVPVAVFLLWWQSDGFRYLDLSTCIAVLLGGFVIGFIINRFFKNEVKKDEKKAESGEVHGRKLTPDDFLSTMRFYVFADILLGIVLAITTTKWLIFVVAAGMTLCMSTLLFYYIWLNGYRKKNRVPAAEKRMIEKK